MILIHKRVRVIRTVILSGRLAVVDLYGRLAVILEFVSQPESVSLHRFAEDSVCQGGPRQRTASTCQLIIDQESHHSAYRLPTGTAMVRKRNPNS